jgi:3-hydroxybutyryl-CoA dehydrogenase|tara:strand:+ start:1492 stop:2484 length:993 start_codon:yes stop_codon:yes gene_type:complete
MSTPSARIGVVGAGRMGRGIALSYIFAGKRLLLVDLKQRSSDERAALIKSAQAELTQDLNFLAKMGLLDQVRIEDVVSRVSFSHRDDPARPLQHCEIVFEGVPEVMDAKRDAFAYISAEVSDTAIIASTTSTFIVTDLAKLVTEPSRFLNAHWLNPAHLMPLVEISKGEQSSQENIDRMIASLESIGKVTVVCAASAGYIVPRIQALAMNEAARLVEEGVASAEDVDKAVNVGFGLRFAVLGLLEFIDWGGGDILHYASAYLSANVGERYEAPKIIGDNMAQGKNGIRDGQGFFDYRDMDAEAYRAKRMSDFVSLLKYRELLPQYQDTDD